MPKKLASHSCRPILFAMAIFSFLCEALAAFPQTVRSKAEERFSAFGWAQKAENKDALDEAAVRSRTVRRFELLPADSEGASPLEEDRDAFPAAPVAALMPSKALPPLLSGAGSLDFAPAPSELIGLFSSIALSLKTRDYSGIKTASSSSFIPVMLEHMTRRLPQADDVWFAGVEVAPDGGSARATLRLRFADVAAPALATAEAVFEDGEWKAVDVIFDNDTYEKAVKQAGS